MGHLGVIGFWKRMAVGLFNDNKIAKNDGGKVRAKRERERAEKEREDFIDGFKHISMFLLLYF